MSVVYEIIISNGATKFLEGLLQKDHERILNALERARIRPEHFFTRLVGEDLYKMRVGDYRVLADLRKQQLQVLVVKVGHRKNIYDGV